VNVVLLGLKLCSVFHEEGHLSTLSLLRFAPAPSSVRHVLYICDD
jgi:hypothetical protein